MNWNSSFALNLCMLLSLTSVWGQDQEQPNLSTPECQCQSTCCGAGVSSKPPASTGTIANTYLYGGERFDSNLNLYQLRARFYNMLTGRFETMDDPAFDDVTDPSSLHKYLYTADNPVNAADPSGHLAVETAALNQATVVQSAPVVYLYALAVSCLLDREATLIGVLAQGGAPVSNGPCSFRRKTCREEFPNLVPVTQLPPSYQFNSENEAWLAIGVEYSGQKLRKGAKDTASGARAVVADATHPAGTCRVAGWVPML